MNRKERRAAAARTAKEGIAGLCRRARANRRIVPNCLAASSGARGVESMVHAGWSLVLTCEAHDGIEHWHLSVKLHPQGRSSVGDDWRNLGRIVESVVMHSGAPDGTGPDPVIPMEETHPNAAHHWCWHNDGSPVSEQALTLLRETLRAIEATRTTE